MNPSVPAPHANACKKGGTLTLPHLAGQKDTWEGHDGSVCPTECSFVAKTWIELLKHARETHKEDRKCKACQKAREHKHSHKQYMKTQDPERNSCSCQESPVSQPVHCCVSSAEPHSLFSGGKARSCRWTRQLWLNVYDGTESPWACCCAWPWQEENEAQSKTFPWKMGFGPSSQWI